MTEDEQVVARVAFDPEIAASLEQMSGAPPLTAGGLVAARAASAAMAIGVDEAIGDRDIEWSEQVVPGPAGAPELILLILRPRRRALAAPAVYSIHGGGMMLGSRFSDVVRLAALVDELGLIAVSPEYRLAPEHPFPAGVEDCYAGLSWLAGHAAELGVAPDKIVVMGGSAGGGLSAGVALLARDRGGPALAGQLLLCPMIDDRNDSESTLQYADGGAWTRDSNELGWTSLLGADRDGADRGSADRGSADRGSADRGSADRGSADHGSADRGSADHDGTDHEGADRDGTGVSAYAAPVRAADVSGLPPAFIEVGEAEIFRDEDAVYCAKLWQAGVSAELHVWARAYHGFDLFAPASQVAVAALAARSSWLRRVLGISPRTAPPGAGQP